MINDDIDDFRKIVKQHLGALHQVAHLVEEEHKVVANIKLVSVGSQFFLEVG